MEQKVITIDAEGQILGRVASRVASLLIGKSSSGRKSNVVIPLKIIVYNASHIQLSGKKLNEKVYTRYSGYPSGLKSESYEKKMKKNATFPLRKAVLGMIPKNRLRKQRMKQLTIYADNKKS